MSVKKFFASKDNTITNAFLPGLSSRATLSNQGASDILEIHSIYGQSTESSLEKTRALIQFPVSEIYALRESGVLPQSGSVEYYLRIFNAPHGSTTPDNFSITVSPILQEWEEGVGLDMETYADLDASNWLSCSNNILWISEGGTDPESLASNYESSLDLNSYKQYFPAGIEDISIDITDLTEMWLNHESSASTSATGSITLTGTPSLGQALKLISPSGKQSNFIFSTSSVVSGQNIYVEIVPADIPATRDNLTNAIDNSDDFTATSDSTNKVNFSQATKGYYGNTKVSLSGSPPATILGFGGGEGLINNGVLLKMSGSAESGTEKRSFYTKKMFARNSQFFFKKPVIEARFINKILDDRGSFYKESNLLSNSENLNRIYFYNYKDDNLVDLATTGSNLLVKFVPSEGSTPVTLSSGKLDSTKTFVTASRVSQGVYESEFSYAGNSGSLIDVWSYQTGSSVVELVTGSSFSVLSRKNNTSHQQSKYVFNITNLKSSYSRQEVANFRVHTRKKGDSLNIYTVSRSKSKVSKVEECYYKLTRVSDNLQIIPYTTGSETIQYSRLSYDSEGSFFDLDMSILEPNYLYQISFLRKEGKNYFQQKEKFKFRIEK